MPALIILATTDATLRTAWERQLPRDRPALRLGSDVFPGNMAPGYAAVVVLDAAAESLLTPALLRCPTIYVGEPHSLPFEQAKMASRAKAYLSYEESANRLGEFLPLLEELAEKQSMFDLLTEKSRDAEALRQVTRTSTTVGDSVEWWDFLEGVVENFETRDQLIAEFRRATRYILKASHAVFFLHERDGFRADRGTSFVPSHDPLVTYFENHPTVIDGTTWESRADPVAELAVRNYLAVWGARLLVPIHDNCRLLGLIALGVRNDGRAYDEADRSRAISFARLLRHFLAKSVQLGRLSLLAEQSSLGAKYLPRTLVLGPNESIPREVPLVVRDLVGQVRHAREVRRIAAGEGQPFRASAGLVAETGGVWAFWEEASAEVHDSTVRARADRRGLLREIALTLSHELSNGLVSLAIFRQLAPGKPLPPPILETARGDVIRLEELNRNLSLMQTLHETVAVPVDMRDLAQEVGAALELRVEVGPEPVKLTVSRNLVLFALRALIATVGENRPGHGLRDLSLQVRMTGEGPERTALLSLKGKHMELEGILPEPMDGSVPNQGRLGVFLAKEILRLHHGEIHAGPGLEGTEILFSVRSL
jgi:hypothetical protein